MNFDEIIDRKNTHCVKYSASATQKRPDDSIIMTLADMDLACCPAITEALKKRLDHPVYGYQQFDEVLPEKVADWYNSHYSAWLNPKDFMAMPSVNTAIAFCILALTRPFEGILIHNPSYSPFRKVTVLNGRTPVTCEMKQKGDHFEIDWDDFEAKLRQSRMFILCSPHNPTSTVFTKSQLERMLKMAKEAHVIVVSDEIHADWVYGEMNCASGIDPDVITVVSASKAFNLQGLQSSFLFVPDPEKREAIHRQLKALSYMNNQVFSHEAILAAYSEQGEQWLKEAKDYVKENARVFTEMMKEAGTGLKPMKLQSTFLMWVDCSEVCQSDEEVVDLFENRCHIYGTTGSHYQSTKPFIRLNIGCSRSVVIEAAERLIQQLKK